MLKLKRFDEPKWFKFDKDPSAEFLIKPASFKLTTELLSKNRKRVMVKEGAPVFDYDEAKFTLDLFREILVDFKGIEVEGVTDKDEAKEVLFNYEPIREFVAQKSNELREELEKSLEAEVKN